MRCSRFLHVDVLYSTVPDAHAEALAHLVPLWKAVGQEERSREVARAAAAEVRKQPLGEAGAVTAI